MQFEQLLEEACARVQLLSGHLPSIVDAAISTAKMPYKVLCYREGLIWRIEELGRAACKSYDRRDDVAGIILTRAAAETAAALWYLKELIERQISNSLEKDLNDKLNRLLLGHKNLKNMPQAIN